MTKRAMVRALALTMAALLALAVPALAAYGLEQVNDPRYYVGNWQGSGGGDAEYEMDIFDYDDGHMSAALAIYRLWNFDDAHIWLDDSEPIGTFTTDGDDHVMGIITFGKYAFQLRIVDSYSEYLPEGTVIEFH